ncbi:MAG: hypothetical protein FWE80_01995 [Oscillospiraceae bacterium]|nr:hypothetical protein [Oscillospiraceae bacterium]
MSVFGIIMIFSVFLLLYLTLKKRKTGIALYILFLISQPFYLKGYLSMSRDYDRRGILFFALPVLDVLLLACLILKKSGRFSKLLSPAWLKTAACAALLGIICLLDLFGGITTFQDTGEFFAYKSTTGWISAFPVVLVKNDRSNTVDYELPLLAPGYRLKIKNDILYYQPAYHRLEHADVWTVWGEEYRPGV